MADARREDLDVLARLRSAGLLTEDQERRVKSALGRGRELQDVLATTPLVEPLQFIRVSTAPAPDHAAEVEAFEIEPLNGPVARGSGLGREAFIDLSPRVRAEAPEPSLPATGEELARRLCVPEDASGFANERRSSAATLRLGDHEEIPLLKDLHGLLREAVEYSASAIEFDARDERAAVVRFFSVAGSLSTRRVIDRTRGAKLGHGLAMQARVASWRGKGRGLLVLEAGTAQRVTLVETDEGLTRLYFLGLG